MDRSIRVLVVAAGVDRGKRNEVPPFYQKQTRRGVQTQICFWLTFASARAKQRERACLRFTIAKATGATKALACCASHDIDGDHRYAAFHCSRLSHRNFLRVYAAISPEDIAVDRCGVDLSLQQDRGRDRRHAPRCDDLGDAGALCCRISVWLLDSESASGTARTPSPVSTTRLRALARIFAGGLAHILASICWFALRRHPFGDIYLLSHALTDQPCPDTTKSKLEFCHVERSETALITFAVMSLQKFVAISSLAQNDITETGKADP